MASGWFSSTPEMELCESCQRFDIQSFWKEPSRRRGYRLKAVHEAADAGCSFCSLLLTVCQKKDDWVTFRNAFRRGKPVWIGIKLNVACPHSPKEAMEYRTLGTEPLRPALSMTVVLHKARDFAPMDPKFQALHGDPMASSDHQEKARPDLLLAGDADSPACQRGDIVKSRSHGGNLQSEDLVYSLRDLLQRCETHETPGGSPGWEPNCLPRRVIYLDGESVRLLETDRTMESRYIALSHRWMPETEASRTTMVNYHDRLAGRGFETLTRTFRETLDLARALDIRHVWIDSICIIQEGDDGRDWGEEVKRMAQYYSNAHLTIAAAATDAGGIPEDRLLPEHMSRDPPRLARLPYRARLGGPREGFFYAFEAQDRTQAALSFEQGVRTSPLLGRAWVYQEYHLSQRFACLSRTGMWFECRHASPESDLGDVVLWPQPPPPGTADAGADADVDLIDIDAEFDVNLDLDSDFASEADIRRARVRARTRARARAPGRIHALYGTKLFLQRRHSSWADLVARYSELGITRSSDRIAALDGLARTYARTRFSTDLSWRTYVCGIWLRELLPSLLWAQSARVSERGGGGGQVMAAERVPGMPSWSWASVMAPVSWDQRRSEEDMTEVLVPTGLIPAPGVRVPVVPGEGDTGGWKVDQSGVFYPQLLDQRGIDNPSVSLLFQARLQKVIVGPRFDLPEEEKRALALSNAPDDWATTNRRKVVLPNSFSHRISGWGSFELPDLYGVDVSQAGDIFACAVFVSSQAGESGTAGQALRFEGPLGDVSHVLFLRNRNQEQFERVGVGFLFGDEVEQSWESGMTVIELV